MQETNFLYLTGNAYTTFERRHSGAVIAVA